MRKLSKMSRQLQLFYVLYNIHKDPETIIGPNDLINSFGISLRSLQRDLKDFRDSGLINLKYNKIEDRYVEDKSPVKHEEIDARRMQHLIRLHRIGTLTVSLSQTLAHDLEEYKYGVKYFNEYLEDAKENPEENTPEDIEMMREFYIPKLNFHDLKAEYYALFPDSTERTRQRDFAEMNKAGFEIYYSKEFKSYIYVDDTDYL